MTHSTSSAKNASGFVQPRHSKRKTKDVFVSKEPCHERQDSLDCMLRQHHAGPHVDVRGVRWNHPDLPHGIRKKKGQ